jgi:hypothetical protein
MSPHCASDNRHPLAAKTSLGLPDDESRGLHRVQGRSFIEARIDAHIERRTRGITQYQPSLPRNPYQDAGLSQSSRYHISKVKFATRVALGLSFDFDDESYERLTRQEDESITLRDCVEPDAHHRFQCRCDLSCEYDRLCRGHDANDYSDQCAADLTRSAPWRTHEPLDRLEPNFKPYHAACYRLCSETSPKPYHTLDDRKPAPPRYYAEVAGTTLGHHTRPEPQSAFTWGDESVREPSRKRKLDFFRRLFRRR